MSYPQSLASQEVLEGQQFYRLLTTLSSAGDVYELDVSATGFVIGPQSDISRVKVTYWDPQVPGSAQSFLVSVDDPFLGRVDAFGTQVFPISNSPARVLISPDDFFTFWQPVVLAQDIVARVNPRLDLISYFAPPTATPAKRADFIQKGRLTIAAGGSGVTTLLYPYFRRKYASIEITNFAAAAFTLDISGIVFTPDGTAPYAAVDSAKVQRTAILTGGAIAVAPTNVAFEVNASTNGLHDYLMLQFRGAPIDGAVVADTVYYTIRMTDEEI